MIARPSSINKEACLPNTRTVSNTEPSHLTSYPIYRDEGQGTFMWVCNNDCTKVGIDNLKIASHPFSKEKLLIKWCLWLTQQTSLFSSSIWINVSHTLAGKPLLVFPGALGDEKLGWVLGQLLSGFRAQERGGGQRPEASPYTAVSAIVR